MKTLLIMRHAKSSWDNARLTDFERPLNKRGRNDAPRMGELLRQEELAPDLIITSSAKRAASTAQAVALASEYENDIMYTRDLYHGMPEDYLEALNAVENIFGRVMVVGHNPGIEDLVEHICGEWERMPTAALAQVQLPIEGWQDLTESTQGKLVNLWLPKELP